VTADTRTPKTKRIPTLRQQEARLAWLLVTPAIIVVLLLVVFPVLWNVLLSLQRVRLRDLQTIDFFNLDLSLDNFERVTGVRDFWETLRTTVAYAFFGTVLSLGLGVWAALVVKKAFIGRSMVRGLMLFPYVAPVIAVTFLWKVMLNPQFGIVNEWIDGAGLQRIDFLGRRSFELGIFGWTLTLPVALTAVIVFEAWRYFPFAYLFILARLQAAPVELEEAAMVDGATISQRFRYVTLPQLRSVLSVLFVLRFIWTFNKFDDIYLLTGGSAGTNVITVKIVDWVRGRADIGSAAALSIVLAIVLIALLTIYFVWFFEDEGDAT
jgi:multiple sugar transport system permease protein